MLKEKAPRKKSSLVKWLPSLALLGLMAAMFLPGATKRLRQNRRKA